MSRQTLILLTGLLMLACAEERPREASAPQAGGLREDDVKVERVPELQETTLTIAAGDCGISWTAYESEGNRGIVRHRSDCGLTLSEQAPLIGKVLRKLMESGAGAAGFRRLSWGRLYPDGARDATMSVRLALAAKRSADWDAAEGSPRGGDINGWVRQLANEALIYEELRPIFREAGLEIRLTTVEKVLVQTAEQLPFYERLREAGTRPEDKVPFDCQAWFSVWPAGQPRP